MYKKKIKTASKIENVGVINYIRLTKNTLKKVCYKVPSYSYKSSLSSNGLLSFLCELVVLIRTFLSSLCSRLSRNLIFTVISRNDMLIRILLNDDILISRLGGTNKEKEVSYNGFDWIT